MRLVDTKTYNARKLILLVIAADKVDLWKTHRG